MKWYLMGTELTRVGLRFPQYLNDDVVIPALVDWGYALKDAREYALAGCWEFIIPGCGGEIVHIEAMPFLQIADRTLRKNLAQSASFEAFMQHFRDEMFLEADAIEKRFAHAAVRPSAIHSLLSKRAVSEGMDLCQCMRYNNFGIHGPGISNAADSLAAIRKNVFEDGTVDAGELIKAIDANYEGYEGIWRKMKYDAPKMGNDDDFVDSISVQVTDIFADAFENRRNGYGGCRALEAPCITSGMRTRAPPRTEEEKESRSVRISHRRSTSKLTGRSPCSSRLPNRTSSAFATAAP